MTSFSASPLAVVPAAPAARQEIAITPLRPPVVPPQESPTAVPSAEFEQEFDEFLDEIIGGEKDYPRPEKW